MKFLFCHVGWMASYHGATDEDYPLKGGKYNDSYIGHEACNFVDINGFLYGYVQVSEGKTINIGRLGADRGDTSIENITVVWLATAPDGGIVVIGWYKDATVYRQYQKTPTPSARHLKDDILYYNIKTETKNAFLLSPGERTLSSKKGKGWPGQSPLWYASEPENQQFIEKVRALINDKSIIKPTQSPDAPNAAGVTDLDLIEAATEGRDMLVTHIKKERNQAIINRKKRHVLKATGHLRCEICNFSFRDVYGDIGSDFCEVHHIKPLSEASEKIETSLDDLAIVCSNCHRMIHRITPVPGIEEFKSRFGFDSTKN
ncbi:hypothetical protein CJP72_15550 [Citrobacter sp. NCU1]|uniref:HNH endonuclease n=1 Tax=Citrobacter sp. NCU1 TaxID=2026683 RepID=UPI0013918B3C|nr:HNH endonuclease [Citrobacter sp. NCU1]NDO82128.1 hypothetical protein [Citrobacter sp. NCU1]